LTPTFSTPVPTATGFEVNVTNFNAAYAFTPSIVAGSAGAVTKGVASGAILPLTVTGLTGGVSSIVSVATTRAGYAAAAATVTGSAALGAALTPTFSTPVPTADGFTVNVTNYNPAYTFTTSIAAGSPGAVSTDTASGAILPLTVTGLTRGVVSTVSIATTRTGFAAGSATVSGSAALGAALTPTFSTPVPTADGFTVNVTNYDPAFAYTIWMPACAPCSGGTVREGTADGAILPLTVTGMAHGTSSVVRVATSRSGHAPGSADVRGSASQGLLLPGLRPTFDAPYMGAFGFTVIVNNFDNRYTYDWGLAPGSPGSVSFAFVDGSNMYLSVTRLAAGESATVVVSASRLGYETERGEVTGVAGDMWGDPAGLARAGEVSPTARTGYAVGAAMVRGGLLQPGQGTSPGGQR